MSKKYSQIIDDLERAVREIESQGISIAPLNKAIEDLKSHSENIEAVEQNIDAVRAEVIVPIKVELEENKKAGKFSIWGFYVGAFGLIVTALSLLYTTFMDKSIDPQTNVLYARDTSFVNLTRFNNIEYAISELNYSINGLNENYQPLTDEFMLDQFETKNILTEGNNIIAIKAYIPFEIEREGRWFPLANLTLFINNRKIGMKGLKDKVSLIDSSGVAHLIPDRNSIELSENDCFILFDKYLYRVKRIFRTQSQILSVCDEKEGVLIERIK